MDKSAKEVQVKDMIEKKVWIFDENHRVYPRDEKGRAFGNPIWRKHWVAREIVGETKLSWILRFGGQKVSKKGGRGIAFSEAEIDRLEFVEVHRRLIAEAVNKLDYEKLKQVSDLIEYKTEEIKG